MKIIMMLALCAQAQVILYYIHWLLIWFVNAQKRNGAERILCLTSKVCTPSIPNISFHAACASVQMFLE